MLAASLVSVPFSLLREPLVRRVLSDMQGAPSASVAVLLKQNREMLERLTFVQSFFEGGPGKLGVKELEKKYTRCAGTLPRSEREQLLGAVREAYVESCEDWWRMTGMDGVFTDDEKCAANLQALRQHVLEHAGEWRKKEVEQPKVEYRASHVGAAELGSSLQRGSVFLTAAAKRQQNSEQKKKELLAAQELHKGYPELVNGKLDSHKCLYCHESFKSKGALFRHLRKMIPEERMINGWHQSHLSVQVCPEAFSGPAPFRCPVGCCGQSFSSVDEFRSHLRMMGTRIPEPESPSEAQDAINVGLGADRTQGSEVADAACADVAEAAAPDPHDALGKCFRCSAARDTVLAQCGHNVVCYKCSEGLEACPVCSKPVTLRIKVCWS